MKVLAAPCLLLASMALSAYAIDRPVPSPTNQPQLPSPSTAIPLPEKPIEPNSKPEARPDQPWLGIVPAPVPEALLVQLQRSGHPGIMVKSLGPDSPAKKAGLKEYDILLDIGDIPISTAADIQKALEKHKPGDEVNLHIIRASKEQDIKATLGQLPKGLTKIDGIMGDPSSPLEQVPQGNRPGLRPRGGMPNLPDFPDFQEEFAELEQQMNEFMQGAGNSGALRKRHQQQIQEMLNMLDNGFSQDINISPGIGSASSFFRIVDNGLSITIKQNNGSTSVQATDQKGKVIFEGPYNTEEEKNNVPSEVQAVLKNVKFTSR